MEMEDTTENYLYSASILQFQSQSTTTSQAIRERKDATLYHAPFSYESLTEGCYKKFVTTVFSVESEFKLESAQKWVHFPGKHQVQFPLQTILPKVQMIRQVPPRQLPRDVEVDRRRRRYVKVRISELLLAANIPNDMLLNPKDVPEIWDTVAFERKFFLPLFVFDDETFDSNSVRGWLDSGLVEDERHPLPAWGLIRKEDGTYSWEMVAVYSYDERTYLFTLIDLNEERTHQVYRIHLMFMAESPYLFVERIKFALQQREVAESHIRYETLLDCILYEGAPPMNQLLLDRILKLALIMPTGSGDDEPILRSFSNEIRLSYQRVMVSYVVEEFLKNNSEEFQRIYAPRRDKPTVKALPVYSTTEEHDKFVVNRRNLRVITLFYVAESNRAMMNAATECAAIEGYSLFTYNFTKPLALPDFVTNQENNCTTIVKFLKFVWPENLAGKICLCLRSIGKGWLDLTVGDWNTFNVAKISRFFLQVKFRMQESLQVLLEKSILNYSHVLNDACVDFLDLEPDYEWTNNYRESPFNRNLSPVFKLVVGIHTDGPFYSTDPKEFEPTVAKVFYSSLMSTCGIRIIDPDSLQNLNFARNLCIFTVELIEGMYIEHDALLHASYSKAVFPLNAYLKKFERYVQFHQLSVDVYLEEFAEANKSSQEVKNEILHHKEQKEELRADLPETIIIGTFQVLVEPIKNYMITKRIEIIRKLFLYYVDRMYTINEQLLEELTEINTKLNEKLVSIEHLFEIKEYMTLVPDKLTVLRERIQIMVMEYSVLDGFFYNLSDHQFGMKWEAFAWPYKIQKRLYVMKEEHKLEIEEFKRIQIRELSSFQERLESLNEETMAFALQFDPEKALEVAVDTKKTWKIIQELQRMGKLLQDRQVLFEAEELSLSYLDSIIESFNPYRTLWSACSDFLKLEEIAVGNPLNTTDVSEIRQTLDELKNTLDKSIEVFSEKEEIQNVARYYLELIETFRPQLDCMDFIKNENWLLMHWQELNHRAGIDIKFSVNMNFAFCIKKGILNHIPLVSEIGTRAVLEADEIRRKLEEEERLRIEAELALLEKKQNRKCRTDIL